MERTSNINNKALTVSTNDTSRKSSAGSWLEMNSDGSKKEVSKDKLKFFNKSGKQYSARITYMNVILKNGSETLGLKLKDKEHNKKGTRNFKPRALRLFSQDYIEDILDFCAETNWFQAGIENQGTPDI